MGGIACTVSPFPDDDFWDRHVYNAAGIRLQTLIDRGVERFLFVLRLRRRLEARHFVEAVGDARPTSTTRRSSAASGGAPLKDVGGIPGLMQFLDAALGPLHVEHNDVVS